MCMRCIRGPPTSTPCLMEQSVQVVYLGGGCRTGCHVTQGKGGSRSEVYNQASAMCPELDPTEDCSRCKRGPLGTVAGASGDPGDCSRCKPGPRGL